MAATRLFIEFTHNLFGSPGIKVVSQVYGSTRAYIACEQNPGPTERSTVPSRPDGYALWILQFCAHPFALLAVLFFFALVASLFGLFAGIALEAQENWISQFWTTFNGVWFGNSPFPGIVKWNLWVISKPCCLPLFLPKQIRKFRSELKW